MGTSANDDEELKLFNDIMIDKLFSINFLFLMMNFVFKYTQAERPDRQIPSNPIGKLSGPMGQFRPG